MMPLSTQSPALQSELSAPSLNIQRTKDLVWWVGSTVPEDNVTVDVTHPDVDIRLAIELGTKPQKRGDPVADEVFPRRFVHNQKYRKTRQVTNSGRRLPYFFYRDFFCIAHEAIDVFEKHNLGNAQFREAEFYEFEDDVRVNERMKVLVPCNPKRGFLIEESPKPARQFAGIPSLEGVAQADSDFEDGDVAVSRSVLDGPDVWIDPNFWRTFFLSNKLAQELIEKDLAHDFCLRWARVL